MASPGPKKRPSSRSTPGPRGSRAAREPRESREPRPSRPSRGTGGRRPREPRDADHPFTDDSRGPRLQKILAEAGLGSRRACEELIESGMVSVNGHVVSSLPAWVDPARDRIVAGGRRVRPREAPVYVMLFKPRGVECTNAASVGRPRAIDLVDHPSRARLYPVGRLDVESSGLVLLTNDGELANRLTHPRYGVHKVYEVTVDGALDEAAVRKLERGVFLSGRRGPGGPKPARRTSASRLTLLRSARDRTRLRMELREGRNRQVRRMLLEVGHKVRKLRRIQLGPLELKGLRPGQWRELGVKEVEKLREAAWGKGKGKGGGGRSALTPRRTMRSSSRTTRGGPTS